MKDAILALSAMFVLLFCESIRAQTPDAPLDFPGGLSLSLPPEWSSSLSETTKPVSGAVGSFENPNVLTLILKARPSDTDRSGSLTIVRDESLSTLAGPTLKQAMQVRLAEMAAHRGYRVESFEFSGRPTPDGAHLGKLLAVTSGNKHRIFSCVELNNLSGVSFRCFWEYDESDSAAASDFESWLSSLTFNGARVAEGLSSSPTKTLSVSSKSPGQDSSPTTSAESVSLPSRETADLAAKNRNALVVIEGENGRGSGFLCRIDGQPGLFTNIHVLSDNPNPRYTTMNGHTLNPAEASLGVGHDIFKASIADTSDMLEAMADMDATVRIGDPIAILGNPEGAGVIKPFEGRILGIGPNLVEVDAPFVSGNSGSPIIHIPTGKVIGIATYLVVRKISEKKSGEVETTVRRFGYRLDSVKSWEPVSWPTFNAQSAQTAKIEETGEEFLRLFSAAAKNKRFSSDDFRNPGIQRALANLENSMQSAGRMSTADKASVYRRFLNDLRTAALSDVNAFDMRTAYDYFKRQITDEKRFREDINSGLSRTVDSYR